MLLQRGRPASWERALQSGVSMMPFDSSLLRHVTFVAALAALASSVAGCALDEDEELTGEVESDVKGGKKKDAKKPAQPPVPPAHRFDVITHNIGGGVENDAGAKGLAYTFAQIDEHRPDVVMLQEVCYGQYEMFKARHPGWNVIFAQMSAAHPGCGSPKGQVLASRRDMVEIVREDLGEVDPYLDKHFTLLCGAVSLPDTARKVASCVTHLRAGADDPTAAAAAYDARGRQIARIHRLLKDRVEGGQAVVVAGDFNAAPRKEILDPLYRLTRNGGTGGGLFDEADQTDANRQAYAQQGITCAERACRSGEATSSGGSKIDFVFFSHNRVGGELGANALGSGGSGHKLVRAWAQLDL